MQNLNWSTNVFLKITFYDLRVTTKSLNKSMQIFERSSTNMPSNMFQKERMLTPFENAQRWMGKNTFHFLLINDDNMIGEH